VVDPGSDIQSARTAGVAVVAFANKPGKERALGSFEPAALITAVRDLCSLAG
jgi:hypothetical protein